MKPGRFKPEIYHDACSVLYSEVFDAYYCEQHDMWVESKCSDVNCDFCKRRPEKT